MLLVEDNTFVAAFISKQINGKRRKTKDTINQQLYVENNWVLKDKEKLIRFFEVLISFIILAFFFIRAFLFKHDHNETVLVRYEGSMKGYYKMYMNGYKKLYQYFRLPYNDYSKLYYYVTIYLRCYLHNVNIYFFSIWFSAWMQMPWSISCLHYIFLAPLGISIPKGKKRNMHSVSP